MLFSVCTALPSALKPHVGVHANYLSPSLLYIGIMSGPNNTERRREIRNSWFWHRMLQDSTFVAAKFIIGQVDGPGADGVETRLEKESAIHKDIVRLSVREGYNHLTNKTMHFFKWYSVHHPGSRFAMKLDDDTFPDLDTLVKVAETRDAKYVYMGALMDGGPVQRLGKWAEDPEVFPDEFYPTYAAGSGYILSFALAQELTQAALHHKIRMLTNEDTTVGVWVHEFAEEHADEGVDFYGLEADVYGCTNGVTLAMQLQEGEQMCMWNKFRNRVEPGDGTCCRPLRCFGLHTVTDDDLEVWRTNPPERCPEGTADPVSAALLDEVLLYADLMSDSDWNASVVQHAGFGDLQDYFDDEPQADYDGELLHVE